MVATKKNTTLDLWMIIYRNAIHMKYFDDVEMHCRLCHSQAEFKAALKQLHKEPDKEVMRCIKIEDNLNINLPTDDIPHES